MVTKKQNPQGVHPPDQAGPLLDSGTTWHCDGGIKTRLRQPNIPSLVLSLPFLENYLPIVQYFPALRVCMLLENHMTLKNCICSEERGEEQIEEGCGHFV